MAHFAKINENNIVENVIVVSDKDCGYLEFPESEPIGQAFIALCGIEGNYKQTSYNTSGNQHSYGKTPFRANYAIIGGVYDPEYDVFYSQPISAYATLDLDTFQWTLPLNPSTQSLEPNQRWIWNEETASWVIMEFNMPTNTHNSLGQLITY
jgi:hypothetical protein